MTDFGYTTISTAGNDNPADNWVWVKATSTPASNGTLTSISAYCAQFNATTATIDLALYSNSSGAPGSLLTASSHTPVSVGSGFGWITVDVSADAVAIVAGTQYWFCVRAPDYLGAPGHDINVKYDTNGGATEGYFKNGASFPPPVFPATASGATSFTGERWSVYGTYTAAATAPVGRVAKYLQAIVRAASW